MQYNTALAFLLSGIGILSISSNQRKLLVVCGIIVCGIGVLTAFQYIINVNLGIDELLMKPFIRVQTSHPGRMAPNTAICFTLTGILLLITYYFNKIKELPLILGLFGSTIIILGLIAFLGYITETKSFYGWGELTRMAIHTSVGFIIIGLSFIIFMLIELKKINYLNYFFLIQVLFLFSLLFFIDLSLPLGIIVPVLYILMILVSLQTPSINDTIIITFASITLTIIGFVYSTIIDSLPIWIIVLNEIIIIVAIILTSVISIKRKKSELEIKELRISLEVEIKKLAISNAELEQFAYVASHDLQEPLRMITSYIQLLERRYKNNLDNNANDFISYIVDGANRMKQIINDLLALSRLNSRGKEFKLVNIEKVIKNIVDDLESLINENGAKIICDYLPEIIVDETQMVQLFQNLIINAIKFRRNDPPIIKITARKKEIEWEFSVQDNGIGIKQEYYKKIFMIFQRLHSKEEYKGSGIGLAVCKKVVERHGGRLWVDSKFGEGSTFIFTIPIK
jgi:signal transduction histidine kinase